MRRNDRQRRKAGTLRGVTHVGVHKERALIPVVRGHELQEAEERGDRRYGRGTELSGICKYSCHDDLNRCVGQHIVEQVGGHPAFGKANSTRPSLVSFGQPSEPGGELTKMANVFLPLLSNAEAENHLLTGWNNNQIFAHNSIFQPRYLLAQSFANFVKPGHAKSSYCLTVLWPLTAVCCLEPAIFIKS